jgi:hypothetical protein
MMTTFMALFLQELSQQIDPVGPMFSRNPSSLDVRGRDNLVADSNEPVCR